jgi:hypothetical protein
MVAEGNREERKKKYFGKITSEKCLLSLICA